MCVPMRVCASGDVDENFAGKGVLGHVWLDLWDRALGHNHMLWEHVEANAIFLEQRPASTLIYAVGQFMRLLAGARLALGLSRCTYPYCIYFIIYIDIVEMHFLSFFPDSYICSLFTCVFERVYMHAVVNLCICTSVKICTSMSSHVSAHCVDEQTCCRGIDIDVVVAVCSLCFFNVMLDFDLISNSLSSSRFSVFSCALENVTACVSFHSDSLHKHVTFHDVLHFGRRNGRDQNRTREITVSIAHDDLRVFRCGSVCFQALITRTNLPSPQQ